MYYKSALFMGLSSGVGVLSSQAVLKPPPECPLSGGYTGKNKGITKETGEILRELRIYPL